MRKTLNKIGIIYLAIVIIGTIFISCSKKTIKSNKEVQEDVLKLAITTGDGFTTEDKIPTPWYSRTFSTNLMFRSLFSTDSSLTEINPDLAESYTVSEDECTYKIKLKEGLKWSDGEALTSEDVIFSIKTALEATTINSIYTTAFSKIKSMEHKDNIITIELTTPYAELVNVLTQFAILPEHSLEKVSPSKLDSDDFWREPVTSGMYTLDEIKIGEYFTLKVNKYYEGTAPKIKKIINYYVSDYVTAAEAENTDYLYATSLAQVERMKSLEDYNYQQVDSLYYKYFIFNIKGVDGRENTAMDNFLFRKGIREAINAVELSRLYPNVTVLTTGVPSNESYTLFNLENAKRDIEASGYDMNRKLRICYYNNDETSMDLINMIVYYLEQTGLSVEATLSNNGTADLFSKTDYDIGFKSKSAFSLSEWYGEYKSTDAMFKNIFGGDTSFDEAFEELMEAMDEEEKQEALRKLQEIEEEKLYKIPLFAVGTYVYTSNRLSIPEKVKFCNPLYSCDIDFANWEIK